MASDTEMKIFRAVFGDWGSWDQPMPSESPDVHCLQAGSPVHGVEITQLFADDTEARLRNIPSYLDDLIASRKFRHKEDRENLQIEKVKLHKKDESAEIEFEAILRYPPDFDERIALLDERISRKNQRVDAYLESCPSVDLVIRDESMLFAFDSYVPFYCSLSARINRCAVTNSGFREIFLLTSTGDEAAIIPLKLNLLIEDIFILERFVKESVQEGHEISVADFVTLFLKSLLVLGHSRVLALVGEVFLDLEVGSCVFKQQNRSLEDRSHSPGLFEGGKPIWEVLLDRAILSDTEALAEEFASRRRSLSCCVPLCFRSPLGSGAFSIEESAA